MTMQKEFKYNSDIHYYITPSFKKKEIDIINQKIIISVDGKGFNVKFPDIFEKYKLPKITSKDQIDSWNTNFMSFWQNQLNFAIWCATTGCGINYPDHLNAGGLLGSLFLFHFYYQTRRILREIGSALPQSDKWNGLKNNYDRDAYEKICEEFDIDPNTDWRTGGIGDVYISGTVAWRRTDFRQDNTDKQKKYNRKVEQLDFTKMTFG